MVGMKRRAIAEDADYLLDMEGFRAPVKRNGVDSWDNNVSENDSIEMDEHYAEFLHALDGFVGVGHVEEVENDPEYVMFLDYLTECGDAYMLHDSVDHGVHLPIIYEEDDNYSDEVMKGPRFEWDDYDQEEMDFGEKINRRDPRPSWASRAERVRATGQRMKRKSSFSQRDSYIQVSSASSEDTISDYKDADFNNRMAASLQEEVHEKRSLDEVRKRRKLMSDRANYTPEETNLNVHNGPTSAPKISPPQAVDAVDEVYNLFLKNYKVTGDSCIYEYGDNKRVYYELPSDQHPVIVPESSNEPISIAARSSDQHPIIVADSSNEPITIAARPCDQLPTVVADTSNEPLCVAARSSDESNVEVVIALRSAASASNHGLPPLPSTVRVATQRPPNQASMASLTASRPPAPNNNNGNNTDNKRALIPKRPPAPLLDKQLGNNLKNFHRVPSKMREKLNLILRQPYNKEEHEQLRKELSFQSPVLIHRDSRSGGSDRPGHMGHSLLDWHPNVKSEIEKVNSNPHKVLNLLRMLAYYIQKQPCGNICKPWMDDSLMTILPDSARV